MPNNNKNRKSLVDNIKRLNNATKSTNVRTYGVQSIVPDILAHDVDDYVKKLSDDAEKDKSLINSHISRTKLDSINYKSKNRKNSTSKDLYEIIKDEEILNSMETMLGSHNIRFEQTLKDYEIIKRSIPQVHKVINSLVNGIISPDTMATNNILGIKFESSIDEEDENNIKKLADKYELNKELKDIVLEYLIASVKYITVVPYNMIPDMLYDKKTGEEKGLNECIEELESYIGDKIKPLSECVDNYKCDKSMLESAGFTGYHGKDNKDYYEIDNFFVGDINNLVNTQLENIEFIDGGMAYFKNAILNEAISVKQSDDNELKSMKKIISNIQKKAGVINNSNIEDTASEGLITEKNYKEIKSKVNFKGCHIEKLPASKTIAFKLRDTVIGYFYIEDKVDSKNAMNNMSSIMDKINASVYIKSARENQSDKIESVLVKAVTDRLIKAVNPKFLNDNMDDIDIIYEFVRVNELHKKAKRVTFFHPDDVCEFRRSDGSIMKNAMFMAKLYILTVLTNVLTNVTRGGDRNMHYVKTGLTTDIEGHVNSAIRAIKQNQIRYSDVGSINEIFNIVGSGTDVFMPMSTDGEKPIETETISGQNVDMNNDFLNFLIRSIIMSFGVPAGAIDDFESVDFAKTIAMSNIDMAKSVFDAQIEINKPLTKLFRLLVQYEFPDYDGVDDILVQLNPPSIIVHEMNKDRLDSIGDMADKLADLLPQENESPEQIRRRIFKKQFLKRNMPTLDWDAIEEMISDTEISLQSEMLKINNNNEEDQNQGY